MRYELERKERRFERFNCRPRLTFEQGIAEIEFGNSGFVIFIYDKTGSFHFTPEGAMGPSESTDKRTKYKTMLCSAFYGLWEWLNDEPVEKRLDNIGALTNEVFARAIEKLFHRFGHDRAVKIEDGPAKAGKKITIDMNYFRSLDANDQLIIELKRYSELAKKIDGVWC